MHLIWVSIISVPPHQCTAEQCAVIILGHPQFCYLNWHAFVPTSRLELLLIPPPETRTIFNDNDKCVQTMRASVFKSIRFVSYPDMPV